MGDLAQVPKRKDLPEVAAAISLGYKRMPTTIRDFVQNPYYLGKTYGDNQLFPYWLEKLEELYPNPLIVSSPIVILTGALGTGKSTFSKIAALYELHKLDCLKDIHKSLGVAKGKLIKFSFQHRTKALADADFLTSIGMIMDDSPYFSNDFTIGEKIILSSEGERSNDTIGSDVIFYVLSELNFINPEIAEYKLGQAFQRWDSRFFPVAGFFGLIIVDSSARGDSSVTDNFIKECPYPNMKVTRAAIWDAKRHLGIYGREGWFKVYAGDSTNSPFIITEEKGLTEEMDPSRVLEVPEEMRPHFIHDIYTALRDQAGWSTTNTGKLIDDPNTAKKQFSLPMRSKEVLTVDFYNKSDKIIYQVGRYLKDIPEDKVIFPRFDIGLVNDKCGVAITYFDKYLFPSNNKNIKIPTYKTPLMVALSREADQETSIYHLFEFIMDLNEKFEIGEFSADQFASAQLLQDLKREGINVTRISVDRTEEPYIYFKNQVNRGYWQGAYNKLAFKELCELRTIEGKIDHPKRFSDGTVGSKDIMDAVSGSVWSCYQNLELATTYSTKNRIETQISFLEQQNYNPLEQQFNQLY